MINKESLTDQYFINRGYKKYDKTQFDSNMILYNFQKRFDDNKGKKYFIEIHKYTNEWMRDFDKQQEWYKPYTYTVSAKYCYAIHELRLHQNDRCKRFTLV